MKRRQPCLAVLPPKARRAKPRAIDDMLLRWADHPRFARLNERERCEVAATAIRAQVGEGGDILVLGAVGQTRLEQVMAALAADLPGVTLKARHFVDQQLNTLNDIDRHDNILLVEGILESAYRDIDHEVQVLTNRGKKVIGCILTA